MFKVFADLQVLRFHEKLYEKRTLIVELGESQP